MSLGLFNIALVDRTRASHSSDQKMVELHIKLKANEIRTYPPQLGLCVPCIVFRVG